MAHHVRVAQARFLRQISWMSGTGDKLGSLRPGRFEGERIVLALAISLLIHALIWGGYELNRDHHWTSRLPFATKRLPVTLVQRYEEPVEFVMVETPSAEAPHHPKYVSNNNSVAADNSQKKNAENPQLNGHQTDVPKTEDELRAQLAKAQAAADPQQASQSQGNAEAKPATSQGDLTLGKPDDAPKPQEQPRPRTLREAYQQLAARFPGMTMKEDGGAQRKARPSLDVTVTGFGDYDERFIETVCHNWWNLLDSHQFAQDHTGKVVLLFRLNYDGSISQVRFAENNVGDLLGYVCEKAVLDGAPYERWSEDMRLKLGDYTDVQFTFDYY
ncbi:MAG TPA: hypothetical protein VMF08_07265 [Candidatus Sulfotelmatobacter sp.]|nr:hypothetical protein [Candidatus Sulfotelmatobacter sp.]